MSENESKRKRGRPPGSKTRPDAPSKIKIGQRKSPLAGLKPPGRDAKGHFIRAGNDAAPAQNPPAESSPPVNEPGVAPAQGGTPPAQNDTAIFGDTPLPPENDQSQTIGADPETGSGDSGLGSGENSNGPDPRPQTPDASADPDSHRPLGEMIFNTITSLLATFIGKFWLPRPVGKNAEAGEIPYDEKEMVVGSICRYFAHIGLALLTPLQEMQMAVAVYCAPRLMGTVIWLKSIFAKKMKPAEKPVNDPRMAPSGNSEPTPKPSQPVSPDNVEIRPAA